MFLIDDLLMLPFRAPVAGVRWVLAQIQTMADKELLNDQVWKERLIELQIRLELGEITEEDYKAEESIVFERLREIRTARMERARSAAEEDDGDRGPVIDVHTGYGE